MKEYIVTRYSFEELSPEAQEKALEAWRYSLNRELPEYFLEEAMLEELAREITGAYDLPGADDLRISYSLSYCQGDGVSFTGKVLKENAPGLSWPDSAATRNLTGDLIITLTLTRLRRNYSTRKKKR